MTKKYDKIMLPIASLSLVIALFLKFKVFKGLGNIFFPSMIGVIFINALISFFVKGQVYKKINFIVILTILFVFMAGFLYSLPNLSYTKAEEIVNNLDLDKRLESPFHVSIMEDKGNIVEAYLFKGIIKGEEKYILVSSVDGEVDYEDVGDSFIDRAMELKEKK